MQSLESQPTFQRSIATLFIVEEQAEQETNGRQVASRANFRPCLWELQTRLYEEA
jgi:hypothetical protein